MRLKGFIIFLIIFTICYIVFFILYDRFMDKKNDASRVLKKEIDMNKFYNFCKFYGLNTSINIDNVVSIYNLMKDTDNIKISYIANEAHVLNVEVIVTVLYLEYLNYLSEKTIRTDIDMITDFSMNDKTIFDKYVNFFRNKADLNTIINTYGNKTYEELSYINKYFLAEGVRIDKDKIYYAGDYNV